MVEASWILEMITDRSKHTTASKIFIPKGRKMSKEVKICDLRQRQWGWAKGKTCITLLWSNCNTCFSRWRLKLEAGREAAAEAIPPILWLVLKTPKVQQTLLGFGLIVSLMFIYGLGTWIGSHYLSTKYEPTVIDWGDPVKTTQEGFLEVSKILGDPRTTNNPSSVYNQQPSSFEAPAPQPPTASKFDNR